jgi:hypothetical protein
MTKVNKPYSLIAKSLTSLGQEDGKGVLKF